MLLTYGYGNYGLPITKKLEGVHWIPSLRKWVVRVKRKGVITTLAAYSKQGDAEEQYTILTCNTV